MEATNGLSDRIRLNVGGRVFETTASTLQSAGPDSLLHALSTASASASSTPVFIDRDPDMFAVLLSVLRTRRLPSANRTFSLQSLSEEATYFGLDSLVRSAACPAPFAGIDASLASTVLPPTHPTISSFSFNGASNSLLVAHGGLVSCYDPDLLLSSTTPTHFPDITAVRGVNSDVAALGSDSSPGLHFYRLSSSCHVSSFHWSDPSDPRIYKARVTALSAGNHSSPSLFTSFECPHKENAVFSIDKETLTMVSEFGRQPGSSAKSTAPGKLTWLSDRGILVGSSVTCGAFGCSGYIRLWDPRSREVVWETSEPGSGRSSRFGDSFADVDVDLDEPRLFKVCSKSGDLAVADLRKLGDDPWVYLKEKNPSLRPTSGVGNSIGIGAIHCYKKQVFVGWEGDLEVWSRVVGGDDGSSDELSEGMYRMNYMMAKEEQPEIGFVKKIEGGGNRLFVSREGYEGIQVWESTYSVRVVSLQ